MDTIRFHHTHAQVVAHRGLSGLETENTCAAFVAAGNRSYFGIETDVHRTADGHFVVFHDDNTARVGVDSLVIEETSFETLRALRLRDKDGERGRSDLRIPTLAEYVSICKKYEKTCVLELKNSFEQEDIAAIVEIIRGLSYLDHVIFISFDYDNLVKLHRICPDQPAQYLTEKAEDWDELIARLVSDKLGLDALYKLLDEELVKKLHDAGIVINVWTCDDPAAAEQLDAWGVDQITTNILE